MAKNINKIKSTIPSWNLSDLYSGVNDARIERDLKNWLKRAIRFEKQYKGKINSPNLKAEKLAKALIGLEEISEQSSKPGYFAQLVFAADANETTRAFVKKIEEKTTEISKHLLFFDLELADLPEAAIKRFLKAPELKKYAHFVKVVRSFKRHKLSEAEEKIIADKDLTGASAFARLFEELTSNAKYDIAKGGKKQILNQSRILALLYSPDRESRRKAADSLSRGLKQNAKFHAFIYNTLVQDKAIEDRLRQYSYPQQARHLANEVSKEVVETIVGVCDRNRGLVSDYYALKRKILGYKELHDYDRYAPITAAEKKVGFEEAKDIILESFGKFSPEMAEIAQKFFDDGWIDAQPRDGKRGGAFCSFVTADLHPYVFLNFLGSRRDVMTLGHELGHAIHAWLARPKGYFSFGAPLVLCETASVFGEMLVFDALKNSATSPKEKMSLLCGKIEDIFASSFRQIIMYEFESEAHKARGEKGELAVEAINDFWIRANRKMFGNSVRLGDDYKHWWMYIPHFIHTPFYVYAYSFGELLTLSLYAKYQKEGNAFIPKYLRLLEAGGSESPSRILSSFDINISKREFWQGGMDVLKKMIEEAKANYKAVKR